MADYFSFVAVILFCISLYNLARLDGWAKSKSLLVAIGSVAASFLLIFLSVRMPTSGFIIDVVQGIAFLIPFLVLFAFTKSVFRKSVTKAAVDAPR